MAASSWRGLQGRRDVVSLQVVEDVQDVGSDCISSWSLLIFYILQRRHDVLLLFSKKISNDQELIQSDPTSCPQNQKGNN